KKPNSFNKEVMSEAVEGRPRSLGEGQGNTNATVARLEQRLDEVLRASQQKRDHDVPTRRENRRHAEHEERTPSPRRDARNTQERGEGAQRHDARERPYEEFERERWRDDQEFEQCHDREQGTHEDEVIGVASEIIVMDKESHDEMCKRVKAVEEEAMFQLVGLEMIFEVMDCPDRYHMLCAQIQLTGDARLWWNAYWSMRPGEKEGCTWDQFKRLIRGKYYPSYYRADMERQFLALRQGTRSVDEYEREFTRLGSFVPDLVSTEEKRALRFTDRLLPA
ncbi:Unknown protein, partial [Striga hermonthica]